MNSKQTNNRFTKGDIVYLIPEKDIGVFHSDKYIVIDVDEKEKTVIIGKGKETEKVSPLVLHTESEHNELLEKERQNIKKALN